MIIKKLSEQELKLIANRGDKSLKEVLQLRSLLKSDTKKKYEEQKKLIEEV